MNYTFLHANQNGTSMTDIMKETMKWAIDVCRQIRAAQRPSSHCAIEVYLTFDEKPVKAYCVREWFDAENGSGDIYYLPSAITICA